MKQVTSLRKEIADENTQIYCTIVKSGELFVFNF